MATAAPSLALLCLAALCCGAAVQEQPARKPGGQEAALRLVEHDPRGGACLYESEHFRLLCQEQLDDSHLRALARLLEGTHRACCALPFDFPCRRAGAEGAKMEICLYRSEAEYLAATARLGVRAEGSRGIFINPAVHAPLASLGLGKGGSGKLAAHVITHELAHQQSMLGITHAMPIWFSEGLAEYVALASTGGGSFDFATVGARLKPYITGGGKGVSRRMGKAFTALPLQALLSMDDASFMAVSDDEARRLYGLSALVTYYFMQLDGQGDAARLKRWVAALQADARPGLLIRPQDCFDGSGAWLEKERQLEAHRLRQPELHHGLLLDGRSWQQLEDELRRKLRKALGIDISFTPASRP